MSLSLSLHQGQPVLAAGVPLDEARAAMILVHGRGASAASILDLARAIDQPGFAYLAPQAHGNTWYPHRFLEPLARNEPHLSSALAVIDGLVARINDAGVSSERVVLLGFSQGACLALEFAARHARRWGGAIGLSGGLIGTGERPGYDPPDDKRFDYDGSLDGAPVFLGCSDVDAHIPPRRVQQSTEVLRALGGDVTERIYPGMGHTINADEVRFVRDMVPAVPEAEP
ncbi:MAG: alpha/beta hydrolase [Thermomicrobiales bacterium]